MNKKKEYIIEYTSTDGNIVEPYSGSTSPFVDTNRNNIPIISNIYKNGKGIIKLEKECYQIGLEAFYQCSSLSDITIPDSVTTIMTFAFSGCTSLSGIIIPNSVTSIDNYAFYNCSSLTGIALGNSITSIGKCTFNGCWSLTRITIPDSVTSIGAGAFGRWARATSTDVIKFPNEQLKIKYFEGDYGFSDWGSLTSVTIPDSVTSIGDSAFSGCTSLSSIIIPNKIISIEDDAFKGCSKLASITVLPKTPPTLGTNVFYKIASNAVIYVPSGSVDVYKSATNWSSYADRIQPIT